jgi:hypothetical protein
MTIPKKSKAQSDQDAYSEQETQRRFEKLLRSALTTPPKPLKSIKPKRAKKVPKKK